MSEERTLQPGDLLSIQEAADLLSVNRQTIRRLMADGTLPMIRVRNVMRVHRTDVEAIAVPVAGGAA